jgi:hypothetical protein
MDRSENIGQLAKALAAAQSEMRTATKGANNPFFKSRYADLVEIMEVCRVPLTKNGLAISQLPSTTMIDGKVGVTVLTILMHASGEWIAEALTLFPKVPDPQGIGGAITYAKRYGLQAITGVVAENEDDDGNAASGKGTPGKPDDIDPVDHRWDPQASREIDQSEVKQGRKKLPAKPKYLPDPIDDLPPADPTPGEEFI